jgi:DNA-directed RNA polymerase subunit alpha
MGTAVALDVDWSTLIRPRRLEGERDATRGDFVCEPLDRGLGDELGRALRHALLHAVPGTAIVAVRARGAQDSVSPAWMRALCLEASQVVVAASEAKTYIRVDASAGSVIRAGALDLAVVDPHQPLCRAEDDLTLELWLERGCGMRFGSMLRDRPTGAWPVDAFFAPVRCADCFTESPRVGPWRHLDRLLIHVETNGAISADEALWRAARSLWSEDRAA